MVRSGRSEGGNNPAVMERFSPATRAWFGSAFREPTPSQLGAWDAASTGRHALVVAPTGSGKTLAAFLWALDQLGAEPTPQDPRQRCRVLYVSPLKALAVDVERNLRSPLTGVRRECVRLGVPEPDITVGIRSGDTPADERRRFLTRPPDVLITTPESLFLILTSRARESLRGIRTVILDEVHAVAGTKRGAHLAVSLERLDALLERPAQRIGLSATVRPVEAVATFLAGGRDVTVVQPPASKTFDLSVVVPVEDMAELGRGTEESGEPGTAKERSSIWPHVEERVVDLVAAHRSTIVFANSRRLAERLTARLNEIWVERQGQLAADQGEVVAAQQDSPGGVPAQLMGQAGSTTGAPLVLARAHHGSVSKEQRALIEEDLKAGRLPAVVATSSLELGIDMGAVDLVIQVESPPSVASGLQRVGRSGHQVGAVSTGVVFPKYRGDLVQTAVVAERMTAGAIESTRVPRNPLDVLAQQVVAMCATEDWQVDDLLALVRRAAPFAALPQSAYDGVLDMLSGRYPSDDFAELRPRLVWDRVTGTLSGRPGAQRLAVTSGGTIPDRGLFGVFLAGSGGTGAKPSRVGELDEEMVYESRVGDVFALGASSWRIEQITHDRVLVTPAPGVPGRLPFWHGDSLGRPYELGKGVGAFVREVAALPAAAADARLRESGLDERARRNLLAYLGEQRQATGYVPDDRTIVVERFRDELGDWRVVVHSPFGAQVHAPWALAVAARLRERHDVDAQVMHADDGLVLRLPDTGADWLGGEATYDPDPGGGALAGVLEAALLDPDEVEALVSAEVGGSALFASRFRECAARALLLPRRDPGRRSPLWQQRQRSAQLLGVASQFGSFPIVLETVREVLQDVYDVPGLVALMRAVQAREVQIVEVETTAPSPFATSLLFGYIAQFLYEGDSPLAERRAAALSLDTGLLAELLGQAELRELLDADAVALVEAELQRLVPERHARDMEGAADLLRQLGPLSYDEALARGAAPEWLQALVLARRAIEVRVAGGERFAAVEDAARLRDGLGVALPVGIPDAFLEAVEDPLGDLVSRYARTHGPFHVGAVADALGLGTAVAATVMSRLGAAGRLVSGEFRPGGSGTEWCDAEVLRRLRRRSVAALRREVEPVPPQTLGVFLPAWQHVTDRLRGPEGVLRVVEQLAGSRVPASALESLVLPARVHDYMPAMLDELTAAGEVVWIGSGSLPGRDGWVSLLPLAAAELLAPPRGELELDEVHRALLAVLAGGGGWFFRALADRAAEAAGSWAGDSGDNRIAAALWDLVWAGRITGDTLAPLRSLVGSARRRTTAPRVAPRARYGRPRMSPALPHARSAPADTAGRWSLLPEPVADPTVRAAAVAEALLDRYGLVTRGAVVAEAVPGGFAGVYRVLSAYEDVGRCRRGYVVEGLGAAQFAVPSAIDRIRTYAPAHRPDDRTPQALVLAATDPANPYGAALAWPPRPDDARTGHRPGRKAGALVVLVDGDLVLYVERGGRTLLSWSSDDREQQPAVAAAAEALARAVTSGWLGRLTVHTADGQSVLGQDSLLGRALESAGFRATPQGLRLRSPTS
ncbi:MAG TPA: ATP-dependent helicase [Candidatus Nanopelagicales bacterium]